MPPAPATPACPEGTVSPLRVVTLGAHLGDKSVDQGVLGGEYLGTTGGCHHPFTWSSTGGHLSSASPTHPAVDSNRQADLGLFSVSPLSTTPTTTTRISIPHRRNTAVCPEPPLMAQSHRVTTLAVRTPHTHDLYSQVSCVLKPDPEDLS